MTRLCAICVKRPIALRTVIDGRDYWTCAECEQPVPDSPHLVSTQEKVRRATRHFDTFTANEIFEAMEIGYGLSGDLGRNAVSKAIGRMYEAGDLVRICGGHGANDTTYVNAKARRKAAA